MATKDHSTMQRLRPDLTVSLGIQQSPHTSHVAILSEVPSEGEKSYGQSQPPIMKAAIYNAADLQDLPDTHTRRPSVRSWSNLKSSVHDEVDKVAPKTIIPPGKAQVPSPMSLLCNLPISRNDSPVSDLDPTDSLSIEARKDSDATVFPEFLSTIKKPDSAAKNLQGTRAPRSLAAFYHTARAIYKVGPQGEGQKLWSSYKQYRKGEQYRTEVKQEPQKQIPAPRRPSAPELSVHPLMRPPPPRAGRAPRKTVPSAEDVRASKESDYSRSSCEVPVQIGPDIQQFVDASKPLPSVPYLQLAPKAKQDQVKLSKPLPSLPLRPTPRPKQHIDIDACKPLPSVPFLSGLKRELQVENKSSIPMNFVSTTASDVRYPKQQHIGSRRVENHISETATSKASLWWRFLTDITPKRQTHDAPHFTNKHTATTNPTISRPRPMTALQNGRTANVAIECGGVGGPGAAVSYPPLEMSENQKSKPKGSYEPAGRHKSNYDLHWARRRKSSDANFACQGMNEYAPGPSRQMMPEPLLSGKSDETAGGVRDTAFYGAYYEVLDEY
jgi:hypothetical protein